ncbi:MAG: TlpA disulfide reductase family protein [Candidatus Angelobacter sp.]
MMNDAQLHVRRLALLFAIVGLALGIYAAVRMHNRLHAGVSLPRLAVATDLSLTDLNGVALQISKMKGKVVLVNFWAAWCTPCAAEVPQFIALQKKYQDQGFQVIGISVEDDPAQLRDFYRKYQITYPVVPGDLKTADAFGGVLGLPTTFLIGRDQVIHGKYNGATNFSVIEREVVALLHAPPG